MEGNNMDVSPILRKEKDRQTTRLIILKNQKSTVTHKNTGVVVEHNPMAVSKNFTNKAWYLSNLGDLKNIKALEIYIQGDSLRKVDFPPAMLARLKDYLARPKDPKVKYDCTDFVHELNGVPHEHANFKPEKWDFKKFDGTVSPGETIVLTSKEKHAKGDYQHFAIYVGDGLFLSKHGNIGPIGITGLDEMKTLYSAEHVFKIQPKPTSPPPKL